MSRPPPRPPLPGLRHSDAGCSRCYWLLGAVFVYLDAAPWYGHLRSAGCLGRAAAVERPKHWPGLRAALGVAVGSAFAGNPRQHRPNLGISRSRCSILITTTSTTFYAPAGFDPPRVLLAFPAASPT